MTTPIPLNLAVEDLLTESLFDKILVSIPKAYAIRTIYNQGGYGYLRRNINGFNNAAKGTPFLIGTDLDTHECPAALIENWGLDHKHPNLLMHIAVREAEAWVLADKDNFAEFLGLRPDLLPEDVETIADAKQALIQLARRSRRAGLKQDICPPANSTSRVGPNYNARLSMFIREQWNPTEARARARSLARTLDRLTTFIPQYQT